MKNSKNPGLLSMFQKLRRKVLWKFIYNRIYYENGGVLFHTLNYGYAHSDSSDGKVSGTRIKYPDQDVYGYQLYSKVLSHEKLKSGMKVLEVGCGTGYGLADHADANPEVSFKGLDFSRNSIKHAESTFSKIENLIFVEGNSMNLPYEDESIDLLLNIESSHCYPDKEKFYSEARRVLKPGGTFLLADFRMPANYKLLLSSIQNYFELVIETDITENVVKSLKNLSPVRKRIFNEYFKKRPIKKIFAQDLLEHFAGIEGSITFNRFKTGYWKYFICVLKKSNH